MSKKGERKFKFKYAVFTALVCAFAFSLNCFGFFKFGAPQQTTVAAYDERGYQIVSAVYLDGAKVGYTPTTLTKTEGVYKIKVENLLYPAYEETFDLGLAKPINVVFKWDLKTLANKCAEGEAISCFRLGDAILATPGGVSLQGKIMEYQKKAAGLAQDACAKDDMFYCALLATMHLDEKGRVRDLSKAKELGKKACDKGEALGCYAAGRAIIEAGEEAEYAYAEGKLDEACGRKTADACVYLGLRELAKSSAAKSETAGLTLKDKGVGDVEKACKMGSGAGCAALGELYYKGAHVEENQFIAFPLFKKACFLLSGKGCHYWAKGVRSGIIDAETITLDEMVKRAQILGYKAAAEDEESGDEE